MSWLAAYVLTVLIEVPLASALAPRGRRRRIALDALLLNTLTHPLLTVLLRTGSIGFAPGEVLVWMVEAAGYVWVSGLRPARAFLLSLVANGATVAVALAHGA